MAGRKVFTSGEILKAADVNSYLMDQVVAVFADSSARSSAIPTPTEGMVTYVEDANRVEVYDGSAFGPIGGILQVVSTTKTDTFSTTSATLVDITGLTVSITPSSTSSKILVFANVSGASDAPDGFAIARGGSPIFLGDSAGARQRVTGGFGGADSNAIASSGAVYLDSPASTSSLTYSIQTSRGESGAAFINRSTDDSDRVNRKRGASSITVMEVAV